MTRMARIPKHQAKPPALTPEQQAEDKEIMRFCQAAAVRLCQMLDLVRKVPEKLAKSHLNLQPGDVLVCTTNSGKLVGKCAYFDLPGRYAFSNHLTRLRPPTAVIDGRFLRSSLWLHWKRGTFDDKCKHWVNQSTLPENALLESEVPLPPPPEQRRIVEKLEKLLGKVDVCKERLVKIPVLLKRFRQAVLAAACSGRLAEDWREANPNADDAPSLIEELKRAHEAAGGHRAGNAAPPTEEAHDLSVDDLPSTWRVIELRDAVCPERPVTYGILKPGPDVPKGIPYVRVADYPGDRLNLDTVRRTTKEIEAAYARACLRTGDVLLSIRGTVGRVIVVSQELHGANITQDTARLSIQPALSTPFVMWCLRSPTTQNRMARAVKGVAVRGINIGDVRALQEPNDEPAAKLLERIHAQRNS
jgi:type I restriction enzyme, S subunit